MKIQRYSLLIMTMTLALLAGCVSMDFKPASDSLDKRAKALKPAKGKALVYVVRPGFIGKPFGRDVFVDGKVIGSNCGGYFVYFMTRPGVSTIKTKGDNTAELKIKVSSGKTYYVEQTVSPGLLKGVMGLKILDDKDGRKKLLECKLSSQCLAAK